MTVTVDPTNPNPSPDPTPPTPPADPSIPPTNPSGTPPTPPAGGGEGLGVDINNAADVNKKLGELSQQVKDAADYKKKVEPILTAIYRDPKVFAAVNESYQVIMGVKQPNDPTPDPDNPKPDDKKPDSEAVKLENDNRNALITQAVQVWEGKHGIDKLGKDEKQTINNKVLTELKGILDPGNTGKTGAELLAGVPVANVGTYLDKAYYLATREERENSIRENAVKEHQNSDLGLIGAIPGGSITEDSVKLSEKEKAIARKQGIPEEKYLANKKEILKRKGSIA
jgi:hypothetical protein